MAHTSGHHPNIFEYNNHKPWTPSSVPTFDKTREKVCQEGFILIDGLCIPDLEEHVRHSGKGISPEPPSPPSPPTPGQIISITGLISADIAGILALGTLFGLDLTKEQVTEILNGAVVDGFKFDASSGTASIEVATDENGILIGRNGEILFGDDDGLEMIQLDTTSTPAMYRNVVTGEENEELQPLLSNIQNTDGTTFNQIIESEGNGIELQNLADAGAGDATEDISSSIKPEQILEFDDKTLSEWYSDNKDIATREQLDAYYDRLNQLTDAALDDMEDVPLTDGYTDAQLEAMTDEELRAALSSMTEDEIARLMRINPDFVNGLDTEIIEKMQYDDLISQAIEEGATDAEIEAMSEAFAEGGAEAAAAATDLPLTILGAGAVGLAWLDGDKEQKKEIAKDAGKTQDWFDTNIVEPTEGVISETGKAIGEGAKETWSILSGQINPFTGKPYKKSKKTVLEKDNKKRGQRGVPADNKKRGQQGVPEEEDITEDIEE